MDATRSQQTNPRRRPTVRKATAAQIRKIHVLRRQRMDEETYRHTLRESYGVPSSKDLSIPEAAELIERLEGHAGSSRGRATRAQVNLILSLCRGLGRAPESSPDLIHVGAPRVSDLSRTQASKLIEALKALSRRRAAAERRV